jgi:hypothetical protein
VNAAEEEENVVLDSMIRTTFPRQRIFPSFPANTASFHRNHCFPSRDICEMFLRNVVVTIVSLVSVCVAASPASTAAAAVQTWTVTVGKGDNSFKVRISLPNICISMLISLCSLKFFKLRSATLWNSNSSP